MRFAEHVARMGKRRVVYRVSVGRPEERPLGRHKRRWQDNIKMAFQEVGSGKEWIDLAQDRDRWWAHVNAVMKLRIP
jgi:hypothetical protein